MGVAVLSSTIVLLTHTSTLDRLTSIVVGSDCSEMAGRGRDKERRCSKTNRFAQKMCLMPLESMAFYHKTAFDIPGAKKVTFFSSILY